MAWRRKEVVRPGNCDHLSSREYAVLLEDDLIKTKISMAKEAGRQIATMFLNQSDGNVRAAQARLQLAKNAKDYLRIDGVHPALLDFAYRVAQEKLSAARIRTEG